MKSVTNRLLSVFVAACALIAASTYLDAQDENIWTNGDGNNEWGTDPGSISNNWSVGFPPADFEWVLINLAGEDRAIFSQNPTGESSWPIQYIRIGQGEGESGELDVTGGTLNAQQAGTQSHIGSEGGTGLLNVSGGEFITGAAQTHIGLGEGSDGTINFSGGNLIFVREAGGTSTFIGTQGGVGTLNILPGAGHHRTRGGVQLGNMEGDFPAGIGTFSVEGSDIASIGIGAEQTVPGRWIQNPGSVLRVRIDQVPPALSGGVRPIEVVQSDGQGGNVIFEGGAILDVDFLEGEIGGSWAVMRWQGELTDNGLEFAESVDTEMWSFEIDHDNKQLLVHSASDVEIVDPDPEGEDGTWIADADGSWGDASNWEDGTIASGSSRTADFSTLDIGADRLVSLDEDRRIGRLLFSDTSGEFSWTLGPEAGNAEQEGESGLMLTLRNFLAIPSIEVDENSHIRIERRLDGLQGFRKTGAGVLELANPAHTVSGDITVAEGVLRAMTGGNGGLGQGTIGGIENRVIVQDGATFELGGNVQIVNKQVRLSGTGASDGEGGTLGAFYADATGLGNGTRWSHNGATNPAIALDADATLRVDGDGFGQNTANVLLAHMNLGGHTLTKTGTGRITLDQNSAATGNGTLHIAEGVLGITQNSIRNGVDLIVGEGADVRGGREPAPLNSTTNTVTLNGRIILGDRGDSLNTNQHVGVLLGTGELQTGLHGSTGEHTLNIRHETEDSHFSGSVGPELSGIIHLSKGTVDDEENVSTLTLDGAVAHRGNTTINAGSLVMGENSVYTFYIVGTGTPARIQGPVEDVDNPTVALNGAFAFDLSEAGSTMGNSWSPVNQDNLDVTVGETFRVSGFTEVEDGVWGRNANGVGYRFTESTLVLDVVQEFEDIETGYQQWQGEFLSGQPEGLQAPGADPDGDGVENLLEYAFNGDPLLPYSAVLPSIEKVEDGDDSFLEITFIRIDADDIVYQVLASDSLDGSWAEIWVSTDHPFSTDQETVRDVQAIGESGSRFLRVMVSQQ